MSKIECQGRLIGANVDMDMEHLNLSLQVPMQYRDQYEQLKDIENLDIELQKHREKRSLNANSYFHVLSDKIADVLTISKARSKNILICKYGQPQMIDNEPMIYKTNAPEDYMLELEFIHCIPVKFNPEENTTFYKVYRGSHTYDTNEMSKLIDGTVLEAKELGIETATPEQLDAMMKRWGVEFEKTKKHSD